MSKKTFLIIAAVLLAVTAIGGYVVHAHSGGNYSVTDTGDGNKRTYGGY